LLLRDVLAFAIGAQWGFHLLLLPIRQ
jgi:hypothetical protein